MSRAKYDENGVMIRTAGGCTVGPGPWCGTPNGYNNHACRCEACTEAWRIWHREWMRSHPEQQEKHRAQATVRYRNLRDLST